MAAGQMLNAGSTVLALKSNRLYMQAAWQGATLCLKELSQQYQQDKGYTRWRGRRLDKCALRSTAHCLLLRISATVTIEETAACQARQSIHAAVDRQVNIIHANFILNEL